MNNVIFSKTDVSIFGEGVKLSNGVLELKVPNGIGPRILHFGLEGGENIFFEDLHDEISNNSPEFKKFGDKGHWHIYGGHRLWTSPEILPRTYYPDNRPVKIEQLETGVRIIQEQQSYTNLQLSIEARFTGENEVTVDHMITNIGAWPVKLAPWSLSVMSEGGLEVIPFYGEDTGFLPNRSLVMWPYSKFTDDRVYIGDKYITLKQDKTAKDPFKVGLATECGWAAYFNRGYLFIKKSKVIKNAEYPDFGCSYETYTNNVMVEMETLSPLQIIDPEKTITHREVWKLYKCERPDAKDETLIDKIITQHL
ncbi:MAG: hypothetical protein Q8865_09785 [Bacillota bacterium]|nr:hypothetical protein [Bacillota bacterium]